MLAWPTLQLIRIHIWFWQMFADMVHFQALTTQDPADVKTLNFFVKFTNDWPDVETYSGSNNPGKIWVW